MFKLQLNGGCCHVREALAEHWKREIAADSSESTTRYYSIAGQRPAMRNNDGSINYLLGDHLGSVSTLVNANGEIISQSRYLPFGEVLWSDGASPTDYSYTGQRTLSDIGLMDYNARFYDPMLGRFTSPDSIVPDVEQVISYDRFAYVHNNPIRYSDPTGHCIGPLLGICVWVAANAPMLISISLVGATLSFVGPSEPDMELMENPEASKERFENALATSGLWLMAGSTVQAMESTYKRPPMGENLEDDIQLYRTMRMDDDGLPEISPSARGLGVRPDDIPVDENGYVYPGTGGISVSPNDPMNLIPHRRPLWLPGGTSKDPLWMINSNNLGPDLTYKPDTSRHGFIEPAYPMPASQYKESLANTATSWIMKVINAIIGNGR